MHQTQRTRRFLKPALALCAAVCAILFTPMVVDACPTCKDAIAQNDPQHQAMVKGYFYSILFMMSTPFVVLGTFGGMAYLSVKRARRNPTVAEDPTNRAAHQE